MWEFLNNATIGAFVGAFSAFVLVMFTDWRRRHRIKTLLKFLVSDNLDHARPKLQAVKTNISLLKEDNKISGGPFMQFQTQSIKDYQHQVLDLLNANEKQGLDAIIYWMEGINGLLGEVDSNAQKLKQLIKDDASNSERSVAAREYIDSLEDTETNLNHFIELAGYYVEGQPHKILEFRYPIGKSRKQT